MFATARSLFLMLVMPFAMLFAWAHLLRQTWNDGGELAMIAAGLVGVAGVATAPWPDKRRAVIAAVYIYRVDCRVAVSRPSRRLLNRRLPLESLFHPLRTLIARSILIDVKWVTTFALAAVLAGCSDTRPEQENFVLQTGSSGAQPFVTALARNLNSTVQHRTVHAPDSDGMKMFELKGKGVWVVLTSMPEDRCDINAPMHTTFQADEFRVDLVYARPRFFLWLERASSTERRAAKRMIFETAKGLGQKLAPFEEC